MTRGTGIRKMIGHGRTKIVSLVATPQFYSELEAQAEFFREQIPGSPGESVLTRFLQAVDGELKSLPRFPQRGAPLRFTNNSVMFRRISIKGFRKYLIFYVYQEKERTVQVVSLLHGARDIESLLADVAGGL